MCGEGGQSQALVVLRCEREVTGGMVPGQGWGQRVSIHPCLCLASQLGQKLLGVGGQFQGHLHHSKPERKALWGASLS